MAYWFFEKLTGILNYLVCPCRKWNETIQKWTCDVIGGQVKGCPDLLQGGDYKECSTYLEEEAEKVTEAIVP
jgi:hypothetical protein